MLNVIGSLLQPGGKSAKLNILIYHRVLDERGDILTDVDIDTFTWHMNVLKNYYRVLSLANALEHLKSGTLPARSVVITFDDGYLDNVTNALPILKSFNFPATFFIATGFLGGGIMWNDQIIEALRLTTKQTLDLSLFDLPKLDINTTDQKKTAIRMLLPKFKYLNIEPRLDAANRISELCDVEPTGLMMSNDGVKQLHDAGMEIGGHTVNHPILSAVDDSVAAKEITQGKNELENIIGEKLVSFAYPNGRPNQDYAARHANMVKKAGFSQAVSTTWGVSHSKTDLFQIPRFTPWDATENKFLVRMWRNSLLTKTDIAAN